MAAGGKVLLTGESGLSLEDPAGGFALLEMGLTSLGPEYGADGGIHGGFIFL
jgi:hypothetical protein